MRFIGFIIVCLTGALLLYGTGEFPDWGDPNSPASIHLSNYYIENDIEYILNVLKKEIEKNYLH